MFQLNSIDSFTVPMAEEPRLKFSFGSLMLLTVEWDGADS